MTPLNGPEYIPADPIKQVVIFLHGLGSNGRDLLSMVPYFEKELPNTAFLAPNAPHAIPFAYGGFQWFDLWDRTPNQIENGVRTAAPLIADFITATAQRFNIPTSKIALVGFSQGTMMALHTGLRLAKGLACIVGYSGAMVGLNSLETEKLKKLPPVLLVHGAMDNVVPIFMSQQAETTIKNSGGETRFVQRPYLLHSIDDIGIKEGITFLQQNFAGKK